MTERGPSEHTAFARIERVRPRSSGGNGGGLRLQDSLLELESSSMRMPVRPVSLTAQRIMRGLACSALIGLLAVAHIQLRFWINDSRLQHQRMQRIHTELLQNYAVLERGNAQLTDYTRLRQYATQQLHMVEVDTRPVAYIPRNVRDKYNAESVLQARTTPTPSRAMAEAVGSFKTGTASDNLLRLVDTGRAAFAARRQ
jgi:hypothetical protein